MTALNPYMTIGDQIIEPLRHDVPRPELLERAERMLEAVGIADGGEGSAARFLLSYPHQFSGGMRQRVMIAMALITRPQLLIADEPTTALDVTVQAQILTIIKHMQQDLGMAVILITHNLGVVAGTCDRAMVMYAGKIMETASTRDLFYTTRHPYTKALMDSMPSAHQKGESLYTIPGMPPDLSIPIAGCPFAARCAHALEVCGKPIALKEIVPGHATACTRVQAGEL
jgi:oligopeptide transport system ATP-binding protein